MNQTLTPVENQNRIWLMDALRGIAILGIFIMNLPGFTFYDLSSKSGPLFTKADDTVFFIERVLLEGKFYSIFSFLFGWGVALQLSRNAAKGVNAEALLRRRLAIMLVLGFAHLLLLWQGDIVALYAMIGFVLLWMRNWRTRTLLITSIILLLSPILLYYLKMHASFANWPNRFLMEKAGMLDYTLNHIKSNDDYVNVVHHMTVYEHLKLNLTNVLYRYADLFFQSRIVKVLGMFIIGYLMGRNDRYKTIINNTRLLWKVAIAGLAIGLPANFLMEHFRNSNNYYDLQPQGFYATIAYAIGVAPLALSYIAFFFLISRTQAGRRLFLWLQPAGKMAFTNYIMHSVICVILFTGLGFAWDRQIGVVYYSLFALLVFFLQVLLSRLWLNYFQFGPLEWLWRSGTYGKKQQFRKVVAA
jgi:uncharacterized protein